MTNTYISAHRIHKANLSDDEIRIIVWKLLNSHYLDIDSELQKSLGIMADIAFEHEFIQKEILRTK